MDEKIPNPSPNNVTQLEQQLQAKQKEVTSLQEITHSINENLSSEKLFKIYEFTLRGQYGVEQAVVFLKDDSWKCVCNYGTKKTFTDFDVEKNLVVNDKNNSEILKEFELFIPVKHKEIPLAFALLNGIKSDSEKSKADRIQFIQTITNIIVVAVENKRLFKRQLEQEAMKKELELAAQMQSFLVPEELPKDSEIEFGAIYLPHKEVGGDYYDVIKLNEQETIFCIADISGKGTAAALLMSNFQANLRALVLQNYPLDRLIHLLNQKVRDISKGEKFITFFIGKYNFYYRKLQYVNAGHNPSILKNGNEIILLEKGSTILGVFDKLPSVNVQKIVLKKNAFILNYTDGLTDLENEQGVHFEMERIIEFFKTSTDFSPDEFNKKLIEYINIYKGKTVFPDDITLLSCVIF